MSNPEKPKKRKRCPNGTRRNKVTGNCERIVPVNSPRKKHKVKPKLENSIEGVMFYSPSTIQSFLQKNTPDCIAYCIGESTAKEAKKYFKDVRVAKIPTVESVIELVNQNYI